MSEDIKKENTQNTENTENTENIDNTEENEEFKFDLNMPDDEGDKIITKKNRWKIGLYALCFAAIAVVIAFAAYKYTTRDPKNAVINAYKNSVNEMLSAEGIIDGAAIKDMFLNTATKSGFGVTYKGSESLSESFSRLEGSGATGELLYDPVNKEAGGSVDASLGGMAVNLAEYYADGKNMYGRIGLLEKKWVIVPQNSFFSAYNSSALSGHFGKFDYSEDLNIDLFDLGFIADLKDTKELMKGYINSENAAFDALKENMTVYENGEEYELENGKKAKGYSVILKGEDIGAVLRGFSEYSEKENDYRAFAERVLPIAKIYSPEITAEQIVEFINSSNAETFGDIADEIANESYEFNVYVYDKKMVRADGSLDLDLGGEKLESCGISLSYPSGEGISDKIVFEFTPAETEGSAIKAEITNDGENRSLRVDGGFLSYGAPYSLSVKGAYSESTADYSFDLSVANEENDVDSVRFASSGTVSQTEEGFDFKAESLDVYESGILLISLGIDFEMTALTEEIAKPEGETVELFTEDEAELMSLVDEVRSGLGGLASMAALMGLGG